jgi:lysozyme
MTLLEQLRRDEGEILHAYTDSRGYTTIGVGVCIDARVNCGITKAESDILTQNRVDLLTVKLEQQLSWFVGLDSVRQDALRNMAYNMGVDGLLKFRNTLAYIEQGNYDAAAAEMLHSVWAQQVGDRAKRLSVQIRTGIAQ